MHQVVLSSRLNSLDHPRLLTSSHARIRVWFWDPHCRLLWIHKRHVFVPIWNDCLSVILDLIVLTGWNHSHMEIVMLPLWAGQGDQRPQLCSWPIKQTESTRNALSRSSPVQKADDSQWPSLGFTWQRECQNVDWCDWWIDLLWKSGDILNRWTCHRI